MTLIKFPILAICTMLIGSLSLNAQDVINDLTDQLTPFLLEKDEVPGFVLKSQDNKNLMHTGPDQYTRTISQYWYGEGAGSSQFFGIQYGMFATIPDALKGMGYFPGTFSGPYDFGSFMGPLVGDKTYVNVFPPTAGVIFSYNNIGIQIHMTVTTKADSLMFNEIIKKVLAKIDRNPSADIRATMEAAKRTQIDESKYLSIVQAALSIPETKEYTQFGVQEDSKWRLDDTRFIMGKRMQWMNPGGTTVGIDICECDSEADAEKAASIAASWEVGAKLLEMKAVSTVDSLISQRKVEGVYHRVLPVVISQGRYAALFYMIDPVELKTEIYASIIKKAMERISF